MSRKLVGLESDLKIQQQVRKNECCYVLEDFILEERPFTPKVRKNAF